MSNSEIMIKAEHVSKKFCKNLKRSLWYGVHDLASALLRSNKDHTELRRDEFWAVDGISFEVRKGETLGIIGLNGSGKTTLLKMLNGVLKPDKGRITIKGRVGALIAIGVGFHPMLTGRENIYLNGSILGLSKDELDDKFNDIIEFADIGDFLDMSVMNYSSGMLVRLGFSVAIHSEPDILLVDEVLSVGDLGFQMKCQEKIYQLKEKNVTFLIVSHNLNMIKVLSDKLMLLDEGCVRAGPDKPEITIERAHPIFTKKISPIKRHEDAISQEHFVEIDRIELLDFQKKIKDVFLYDEPFCVKVWYSASKVIINPNFGVEITRSDGISCVVNWSNYTNFTVSKIEGRGFFEMWINGLYLAPSKYSVRAVIADRTVWIPLSSKTGCNFQITSSIPYSKGIVFPKTVWKVSK